MDSAERRASHVPQRPDRAPSSEEKRERDAADAVRRPQISSGYQSLFNGRDLSGWEAGSEATRWSVDAKNHALVGDAATSQRNALRWLFTKQAFSDFRLRFEFRMEEKTHSGITMRTSTVKNPSAGRLVVQLLNDPQIPLPTGTIPGLRPDADHLNTVPRIQPALKPPEGWNLGEVEFRGPHLRVTINGQVVQDLRIEARPGMPPLRNGMRRPYGRLGLLCDLGHVEFRNIEVAEL
jgi:Domain of Unknown Function (DUF1080)